MIISLNRNHRLVYVIQTVFVVWRRNWIFKLYSGNLKITKV